MISFENISVTLGNATVIKTASGSATSGEFIALIGPNGSGKSSLLKALADLIPHDGSTSLPRGRRAQAKVVAYLAQNATAPSGYRVRDIVRLGRNPHVGTLSQLTDKDKAAVDKAIEQCGIGDLSDRLFGTLSGGEQTRVHLARTLATDAPLILADEPVTALDPYYQLSVLEVLRKQANDGATVIAALHDLTLAKRFCDRVWVMESGSLVADGPPTETLTPEVLKRVFRITQGGDIVR